MTLTLFFRFNKSDKNTAKKYTTDSRMIPQRFKRAFNIVYRWY